MSATESQGSHSHDLIQEKKHNQPPAAHNPYRDQQIDRFVTPGGNPVDNTQPAFPVYHRNIANPAPLGLIAFGTTTFLLALFNIQARGITHNNVALGLIAAYGGLMMTLAGMWEFAMGNTFGATSFTSYGAFWFSLATLYIPQLGVEEAFYPTATNPAGFIPELYNSLGFFFLSWAIVSLIFLIAAIGSSFALAGLFVTVLMQFVLLSASNFSFANPTMMKNLQVAAGAFGFMTAAFAFYVSLANMLTKDTAWFMLPVGDMHPAKAAEKAAKRQAAREEKAARKGGKAM